MITLITITHSRADGTLIESGEYIPPAAVEILRAWPGNFRWFGSAQQYGVPNTRDKRAATWKLNRVAESLRAAGFEAVIEITEDEPRSFAEREAERNERAAHRAGRRTELADKRRAEAGAAHQASDDITDGIPMGQPILVGHHSEGRHRRTLNRAHNLMERSREQNAKADYHEHRAEAAARYRQSREDIPTTLKRITRLEANERRLARFLAEGSDVASELAEVRDELNYWRQHVAAAEAAGLKLWSRADFSRGDWVRSSEGWDLVERVNTTSLSLPTAPGWNQRKLKYADVLGRMSAEEMATARAEAKARKDAEAQQAEQ